MQVSVFIPSSIYSIKENAKKVSNIIDVSSSAMTNLVISIHLFDQRKRNHNSNQVYHQYQNIIQVLVMNLEVHISITIDYQMDLMLLIVHHQMKLVMNIYQQLQWHQI